MSSVETLSKSIMVLNLIAEQNAPIGVRDISKAVQINTSTISRILKTFLKNGFVEQETVSRKYRLGIRLFELGNLFQNQFKLREHLKPVLEDLVRKSKETAVLSIHDNGERVCIDRVESPQTIRTSLYIGKREPMHMSASGKAMLAYIPEKELDWIISEKGLTQFTASTITDPKILKKDLLNIRKRGYATDLGESEPDVQCVAVPLISKSGTVVGAISISAPEYRASSSKMKKWGKLLKDTCASFSNIL